MTTTRDRFLEAAKRRFLDTEIDGLGSVRLRNLSEGERSKIEALTHHDNSTEHGSGTAKWKARVIVAAVVDEDGKPEFDDKEIGIVLAMDSAISDKLYEAIMAHCEPGTAVKELEKN